MRRLLNSVAILDLDGDGMIIDPSARDQEARRRVLDKLAGREVAEDSNEWKGLFYATSAFYDKDLLPLDKLQPGAIQAIERIRSLYMDLYIVTSRPDFLAGPTLAWLRDHDVHLAEDEIRFKLYQQGEDRREQFVSTPAWKSTIAHEASWIYRNVLLVDNEEKNRRAVAALRRPNITIKDSLRDYVFDDGPIFA